MKHDSGDDSIRRTARRAIDRDGIAELLDRVEDTDYDADAIEALHEVAAEVIVRIAGDAAQRARRRGRQLEADDVASAFETSRPCCCGSAPSVHRITVWEN